jgi:hypothetical protein
MSFNLPVLLRADLQSIAGRLVIVGVIECIARPILLAWPLWRLISEAIQLIRAIDEKKGHTPIAVLQLLKSLLLLGAVMQLIRYLDTFRGTGYACGILGLLLLFIQTQDYLIKPYALPLAENLSVLSGILEQVHLIEMKMLGDSCADASLSTPVLENQRSTASSITRPVEDSSKSFAALSEAALSALNSVSKDQVTSIEEISTDAIEESTYILNSDQASLKEPTSQLRYRRKEKY